MDTTFPHEYEAEQLSELPSQSSVPHYYYPGASLAGGRDGLGVEVHPSVGQPWQGTFAFGQITPRGISGIFTTPEAKRVCVVSRGEGYFIDVENPIAWEPVRATPIVDVRPIKAQGIIVFANFTELVAYGDVGIKWRTRRLGYDGLRIVEATDDVIRGEFWDLATEAPAEFVVDLATGEARGGVDETWK